MVMINCVVYKTFEMKSECAFVKFGVHRLLSCSFESHSRFILELEKQLSYLVNCL